ncbi:uncharacterized protein LOC108903153 [Anoplophora glabripennis]|uniref:uncharacterized protein LOC108903153 n=1 Tax=Anoplophora glabripennis TaxID=217634 RepID=UPI000875409E|nr:uncharacterized protein LOC108903153 [Anoplophora glabripennis]
MHKILSKENLRIAFAAVTGNVISNITDGSYERISFVLDLSCEKSDVILNESRKNNKFRFVHSWLMVSNSPIKRNDIKNMFENVTLRMDTDIKLAVPELDNRYSIFEIYHPGLEGDIKINEIGVHAYNKLTYFNKDISFYSARKDMSGILIRTGNRVNYSLGTPENYTEALRHRNRFTFGKFHFQLFLHLVYIHEFHYNTTIRAEWFGNSSSGIEAGLSRLLWDNEIDISSAGGILRAPRMHYYDYLLPYYQFRTSFFFRNPGNVSPGGEVLRPFSVTTWYCFLAATIVVSLAIKAAYWIERTFLKSRFDYSLVTSFVTTISLFAQQGTNSNV